MSLNPLNELKRRLNDNDIPLSKRMCLAKNVIQSHHFPAAPKERVVAAWLDSITHKKGLSGVEFRNLLSWLKIVDDLTSDLKAKLVQIVAEYVKKNPLQNDDIQYIIMFMENENMATQLSRFVDEYLFITITLLKFLNNKESTLNTHMIQRVLNNLTKYHKDSKKKLEFIIKLLDGENLETVFSYLETECRNSVINVCQNVLFPINKKSFFISFLQTLIRKENIDDLVAEKGDNIQSVLKIMSAFFTFPKGRTSKDQKFLKNFVDVFVSCYHSESQMIFAFYIMVTNSLNMAQSYLIPTMNMPKIVFEDNDVKIKRNLFLSMLEIVLQNEIDISVRLTDTFGEKISKVEIKKNFTAFLQAVMMRQLKLEGKLDKSTLQIVKVALKLDPILVEQNIDQILPPIMIAKKNNSNIEESYVNMLNCLLEILFKLSRGNIFLNQILPHVKLCLEACNTEQFELKQKIQECTNNGTDCEKMKNKIITGNDIFPQLCVEMYGKWTSELMFRQNGELLVLLQKDFEEYCLMMLEEGFVSPSIITLCEVLSAILSSFLQYCKMADHTVPQHIAEDFWNAYQKFEVECLKKFGECILKLNYNPPLLVSFLKLCLSFSRLKLLHIKYSNVKLDSPQVSEPKEIFDLSIILPCLSSEQWISLAEKVVEDEALLLLDNLLLTKTMAIELFLRQKPEENTNQAIVSTKSHIIKRLTASPDVLTTNKSIAKVLFTNLERSQLKPLSKCLVKLYLNNTDVDIFNTDAVINNRPLLNALVLETAKNIIKCFENANSLSKAFNKTDFDLSTFLIEVDVKKYFNELSITEDQDVDMLTNCVELLKQLQIYYLEESYQLTVVFVLLALKKCSHSKKLRRNIDYLLQSIFELSPKNPDVYKIFPVDFIFSFEDRILIDLFTLKIKTSNQLLIIKRLLESAVKKVKTDSGIVKNIVEILLAKQKSKNDTPSIEYFSDPVFQISCIILPIIAKERKAINTSAYRSILANLQEELHKTMLDAFKNIDFSNKSLLDTSGNIDNNTVSESTLATLNAMDAYSLSLSKYCGTTNAEEIKHLDCLWSGLEFFVQNAIQSIQNEESKNQHVESSIQLLNITLRCLKKLETHEMFQNKDKLFLQIWQSIKSRLLMVHDEKQNGKKKRVNDSCLEEIAATLKFVCELSSVESFGKHFVEDLNNLIVLKKPLAALKEAPNIELTAHKVSQYLWTNILKANIVGPKCSALTKLMFQTCKNLRFWIQQHYESDQNGVVNKKNDVKNKLVNIENENGENEGKVVKVEDIICEIIQIDLKTLSEVILSAKKINVDYKFLDAVFELQHLINYILGCKMAHKMCEISWQAFFKLFSGSLAILNNLLLSREEILEDRWPCYMQCYKALVSLLCERSTSQLQLEKTIEEKLAKTAHSIEKLTQSICKRKAHISRLAAYTVADICSWLERTAPSRIVRQHLENSVALLIQASDSTYAMTFLRRALAGSSGQMTMTNLYTMYKRYHKYVGNA